MARCSGVCPGCVSCSFPSLAGAGDIHSAPAYSGVASNDRANPWDAGNPKNYWPPPDSCTALDGPFWQPCPNGQPEQSVIPFAWHPGYNVWGRLDANPLFPDTALSPATAYWGTPTQDGTPKLKARGLILGDLGDSPDIQLRASGPDRGAYNGKAEAFAYKGSPIAKIYGQVYAPDCEGNLSFYAGCGHWGRLGIIEFGITDTPTATNRPSYIKFYNTPPGSADSRGDFYMANGQLLGLNVGTPSNPIYGLP
jgi:hypothetical protein